MLRPAGICGVGGVAGVYNRAHGRLIAARGHRLRSGDAAGKTS
jgi:hypothetical protein